MWNLGATVQTKTSQATAWPGGQRRYVELCSASLQLVSGACSLEGPRNGGEVAQTLLTSSKARGPVPFSSGKNCFSVDKAQSGNRKAPDVSH